MLLLAQLHEPKTEYLDQRLVTMTAVEEKDVHQTATRHFEEDRNELRGAPRAVITSSGTDASRRERDVNRISEAMFDGSFIPRR
jgi:hypothetical protein